MGKGITGQPVKLVGEDSNSPLSHGDLDVAAAGTAEALGDSSVACRQVMIMPKSGNTGTYVYVGGASVPNDETGGVYLGAGQAITIDATNLGEVYVNVTTSGDGVTYLYW